MSSSDQLAAVEPWMFRSSLAADSWMSEAFARDTDALTRALQQSLSNNNLTAAAGGDLQSFSPYFTVVNPDTPSSAQTFSGGGGGGGGGGGSGSDFETVAAPKRRINNNNAVSGGKITKRKSRASKRNTTTFITADPANFRQMVQQVTGVKFGNGIQMPVSVPLLKPEPQRAASFNRFQGCLPTLDTSAFLLDRHNSNQQMTGTSSTTTTMTAMDQSPAAVADGGSSFELESYASYPTLESWN